jgi:hypothetical protein
LLELELLAPVPFVPALPVVVFAEPPLLPDDLLPVVLLELAEVVEVEFDVVAVVGVKSTNPLAPPPRF